MEDIRILITCPECSSLDIDITDDTDDFDNTYMECRDCGHQDIKDDFEIASIKATGEATT